MNKKEIAKLTKTIERYNLAKKYDFGLTADEIYTSVVLDLEEFIEESEQQ